jgi:hypothetical protein
LSWSEEGISDGMRGQEGKVKEGGISSVGKAKLWEEEI